MSRLTFVLAGLIIAVSVGCASNSANHQPLPPGTKVGSYLLSYNLEWRCRALGKWLGGLNLGQRINKPFSERQAIAFRKEQASRFIPSSRGQIGFSAIGQQFTHLTSRSRRAIHGDLERCFGDTDPRIAELMIPFSRGSTLKSSAAKQWMIEIYSLLLRDSVRTFGLDIEQSLQRVWPPICNASALAMATKEGKWPIETFQAGHLELANGYLKKLILYSQPNRVRGASAVLAWLAGIRNSDYKMERDMPWRSVYNAEIDRVTTELNVALGRDNPEPYLTAYVGAMSAWADQAIENLDRISARPDLFRRMAAFDTVWARKFERKCLKLIPDQLAQRIGADPKQVTRIFAQFRSKMVDTMAKALRKHSARFERRFAAYSTLQEFDEFEQIYSGHRSHASYQALRRSGLYLDFQGQRVRLSDRLAKLTAERELQLDKLELEVAGFRFRSEQARSLTLGVGYRAYFQRNSAEIGAAVIAYSEATRAACFMKVPGGTGFEKFTSTRRLMGRFIDKTSVLNETTVVAPKDFLNALFKVYQTNHDRLGKEIVQAVKESTTYAELVRLLRDRGCMSKAHHAYHQNLLEVVTTMQLDWGNLSGLLNFFRSNSNHLNR